MAWAVSLVAVLAAAQASAAVRDRVGAVVHPVADLLAAVLAASAPG